jgi:hypothetical protein
VCCFKMQGEEAFGVTLQFTPTLTAQAARPSRAEQA